MSRQITTAPVEFITMGQNASRAWASEVAGRVGRNIQRARKLAGMSAQDLSNACELAGYPIPRSTIANVETGRKESVVLQELLVIAEVLDVPPLTLIYLPDDAGIVVERVPGKSLLAVDAASDFGSDRPAPRSELARRQQSVQSLRRYEERAEFALRSSSELLAGNFATETWWMDPSDVTRLQSDPGAADDFARQESKHLIARALTAVRSAASIRDALAESGVTLWGIPEILTATYEQVLAEPQSAPRESI